MVGWVERASVDGLVFLHDLKQKSAVLHISLLNHATFPTHEVLPSLWLPPRGGVHNDGAPRCTVGTTVGGTPSVLGQLIDYFLKMLGFTSSV